MWLLVSAGHVSMKLAAQAAGLVGIALLPVAALGADWSNCQSALEQVRDEADSAADEAERAERAARELEDCRLDPSLSVDRCRSERDDYEYAARQARDEADTVASELGNVRSSCGLASGSARLSANSKACKDLNAHTDQGSSSNASRAAGVLRLCFQHFLAFDCLRCLGYTRARAASR